MSQVHIGTITKKGANREVELLLHVTLSSPVSGIIPTPTSSMESKLNQTEKDDLAIGALVEQRKTIVLGSAQNLSDTDVQDKIKLIWTNISTEYDGKYNTKHANYGDTVSVP